MSYTFSFDGPSSVLTTHIQPVIDLRKRDWAEGHDSWSDKGTWVMGLLDFAAYNTTPNVDETNNQLHYTAPEGTEHERANSDGVEAAPEFFRKLVIPVGTYAIEDLNRCISNKLARKRVLFELHVNKNTLQSTIRTSATIDFTQANSIGELLGFPGRTLGVAKKHDDASPTETFTSTHPVHINRVNIMRVLCNITSGCYRNGEHSHIIHEFFPRVPPGHKIVETPTNVVYLPINTKQIDFIVLRIVDQDNRPIDFRGEPITIRLHLKRERWQ